jgi:hypothetical protein
VDIVVERKEGVLVLPRDAVVVDAGGAWVRLRKGGSFVRQAVRLGSLSDEQAIVTSGVPEGAVVARRAAAVG